MKAISRSKHEHLCGSLEELRYLLADLGTEADPELMKEVVSKHQELEEKFRTYHNLLKQLETLVKGYDQLSTDIRFKLLGKHLREMQKTMQAGHPAYAHWHKGVQLLYGT